MESFRDRHPKDILRVSGVCYNLVWKDKEKRIIFCPLHPEAANNDNGNDMRKGHCNPRYLCKTAYKFRRWSKKKQDRYIKFLKSKNLEWYEYSVGTDDNSLLEEFEKSSNIYI